jgi:hypothetical protein
MEINVRVQCSGQGRPMDSTVPQQVADVTVAYFHYMCCTTMVYLNCLSQRRT